MLHISITKNSLIGQHSRTLNSLYIFLSVRQREIKSRRGVFLITQIYTEPLPERGASEFSEQGKPDGKAVAREPGLSTPSPHLSTAAICLFSSHRCNPRTKCYPCSLTLISRMQYNREHNLEIARIILATGLIKACICNVYICACACVCMYQVFGTTAISNSLYEK